MKRLLLILLPALLSVALFGAAVFWYVVPQAESLVMAGKRQTVEELVSAAKGILASYYSQAESGILSTEEAKARAKARLRLMRYGPHEKDYFWVHTEDLRVVMHPYRPDLEGESVAHLSDPQGNYPFQKMARAVEADGGGFVRYHWQWKDNPERVVPKLSYVELFEPWGWVVGTGVYLDDVRAGMAAYRQRLTLVGAAVLGVVALLAGFMAIRQMAVERERYQARMALAAQETHYRTLFTAAHDAIFLLKDGAVVDCNQRAQELLEGSREELLGLSPVHFSPPRQIGGASSAIEVTAIMNEALQGRPQRFPWQMLSRRGRPVHVEVSLKRMDLPEGPHLLAIVRDVGERKEAEDRLRRSEANYRAIFDSSNEAIFVHDAADGKVVDVNRRVVELYGYEREELVGGPAGSLTPEADPANQRRALERIRQAAQGAPQRFEWHCRTKSGGQFWGNVLLKPARLAGQDRVLAFVSDISAEKSQKEEQKRLEGQLLQAQKMEAIGTLAGGIAHDFNNLLTTIIGFTEVSLQRAAGGESPEPELNHVLQASFRARDLVRQILAFSRERAGKPAAVELGSMAKETMKLIRASTPSLVQVRTRVEEENLVVEADPVRLQQVLMNLCANSLQAMGPDGGELVVTVRAVELDRPALPRPGMQPGRYVELAVSDTGPGFDPELLARLFEPFFTTKAPGEGTGLGLSVVHGIVTQAGGGLEASSAPGSGATFRVYLPRHAQEPEELAPVQEPAPERFRGRVLLVDDEEPVLQLGRRLLRELGFEVEARLSPVEARRLFEEDPGAFDLVITDFAMPGMSGLELCASLKETRPGLEVLICTGLGSVVARRDLDRFGVGGLLFKPFTKAELRRAIGRLNLDLLSPRLG
jgi:PAS domain S-box-containing protein